jgi:hypothetical protein
MSQGSGVAILSSRSVTGTLCRGSNASKGGDCGRLRGRGQKIPPTWVENGCAGIKIIPVR